jgi:AmmeMemoRadiSam system protein A
MTDEILGIVAPHPPIMVPEVGRERAHVTADSTRALGSATVLLEAFAPDTLVLMSPHAPVTSDAFVIDDSDRLTGDFGEFGAAGLRFDVRGDPALSAAISQSASDAGLPIVARSASPLLEPGVLDHGAMVPLSFLDRAGRYAVVELSLSFLPLTAHRLLGRAVREAARQVGRRIAFVASGDCSHRLTRDAPAGFSPRAAEFDARLVELLSNGDFAGLENLDPALIEAAGECGLRSFVALGGYAEGSDAQTRVLAYEGPWGVGYLTAVTGSPRLLEHLGEMEAADEPAGETSPESAPVALARQTIETYVREHRVVSPPSEPQGVLRGRHGAFVSLHRSGSLRGCIGTIEPTRTTLADEIVHNAIQAATADPRFDPLAPAELDDLEISVDVLHPAEPTTVADLDPRTYGVIVSADWRRGLLLPDLEGVDTAEEQIAIALQKAGIGPHERYRLERFKVDRYH